MWGYGNYGIWPAYIHTMSYMKRISCVKGVLDTPPRIPTIPTKFRVEFGWIGWNLVGMVGIW